MANSIEIQRCKAKAEREAREKKEKAAYEKRPDVVLAKDLLGYRIDDWVKIGLPKLKEIKSLLEKAKSRQNS
jgi:hypothetical protein